MTASTEALSAAASAKLPRQIPYIIGNEACERFSFYGMRNILVQFLIGSVILAYLPGGDREGAAKDVFHSFVIGVYFFPLLGGWLSDRFFGKYNTVLWFSLIYCAGHACLALFDSSRNGFYTGLFLIALGSGGIKPLVVSFVGDQFIRDNKHLAKVVFDAFYWTINFGSFFASLLMPLFLRGFGRWTDRPAQQQSGCQRGAESRNQQSRPSLPGAVSHSENAFLMFFFATFAFIAAAAFALYARGYPMQDNYRTA